MSVTTSAADLVAGEQMPAANAAEGDREIGAWRAVHDARSEVDAGRSVDGDDRHFEIGEPVEQRRHRRAWRAGCAGAEQRVHRQPDARPRPVGATSRTPSARRERHRRRAAERRFPASAVDPDRHAEPMQRAGDDPAVAAVVARPGATSTPSRSRRGEVAPRIRRQRRGRRTPSAWPGRSRPHAASLIPGRRIVRGERTGMRRSRGPSLVALPDRSTEGDLAVVDSEIEAAIRDWCRPMPYR